MIKRVCSFILVNAIIQQQYTIKHLHSRYSIHLKSRLGFGVPCCINLHAHEEKFCDIWQLKYLLFGVAVISGGCYLRFSSALDSVLMLLQVAELIFYV